MEKDHFRQPGKEVRTFILLEKKLEKKVHKRLHKSLRA